MANVRVYQADISAPCKFMDYNFTMNHGGVERKYYKTVFSGELPVSHPEEIYMLINTSIPEDYEGHSLSVSDVITVDGTTYFVDSFGFKEIDEF